MKTLSLDKKYKIINILGKGSFSKVYKIENKKTKELLAWKKVDVTNLKQKEIKNSLKEIIILSKISNSNIIKFIESFIEEKDNSLCIIMELAPCGDLYEIIKKYKNENKRFKEETILNYFFNIVEGLNELHKTNIYHRDLKSANIFLFNNYKKVKIGDFNVSIEVKNHFAYTQTGTPFYAAPEVWRDEPYDSKADIWSLGCIFYELCMLRPPFISDTAENLNSKIQKGQFGKMDNFYSNKIINLIKCCLKVDNLKRYSAKELLNLKSQYIFIPNNLSFNKFKYNSFKNNKIKKILTDNKILKSNKKILNISKNLSGYNRDKNLLKNYKYKNIKNNIIINSMKQKERKYKIYKKDLGSLNLSQKSKNYNLLKSINKNLNVKINNKLSNINKLFLFKKEPLIEKKLTNINNSNKIKNVINHSLEQNIILDKIKKFKKINFPDFLRNSKEKNKFYWKNKLDTSIKVLSNFLKNKNNYQRKNNLIYRSANYKNRINIYK